MERQRKQVLCLEVNVSGKFSFCSLGAFGPLSIFSWLERMNLKKARNDYHLAGFNKMPT